MPRNRAWQDTLFDLTIVPAAAQSNTDLLANAPPVDTLTVIRMIVGLEVYPSLGLITDGLMAIDMGIGVTSLEAFTVNATPDVNVDDEYPPRGWLWIARKGVYNSVEASSGLDTVYRANFEVDLRAMRKIDKGKLYLAVSSTVTAGSAFNTELMGRVRVLCLT